MRRRAAVERVAVCGPILLGAVVALAACGPTVVVSTGAEVAEERTVEPFTALSVDSGIEVRVLSGEQPQAVVRTGEDLVDRVVTQVRDGTLEIRMSGDPTAVLGDQDVEVDVTLPGELLGVTTDASSVVRGEDELRGDRLEVTSDSSSEVVLTVSVDELDVDADASSVVELSGAARTVEVVADSSATVRLGELPAAVVTVDADASSDVLVTASDSLTVQADGAARVAYRGDPEVVEAATDGAAVVSRE